MARESRKGSKDERANEGTEESKGGERTNGRAEGGKESPEGPLVAQLSHLPIGPSHVLICLLVNPRRPPFIVYFALDFRGTPAPSRPASLGLFLPFFRSSALFPLLPLFLSLSLSFLLAERDRAADRSKMNSTADR